MGETKKFICTGRQREKANKSPGVHQSSQAWFRISNQHSMLSMEYQYSMFLMAVEIKQSLEAKWKKDLTEKILDSEY